MIPDSEKNAPARIAVVDNDSSFRKVLIEKIRSHPLAGPISEYSSGEEFWHKSDKENIDILFLDISMPGLNGLDLLNMISEAEYPARVIMLTNLFSEDTIVSALKRGAIGYLWKNELDRVGDVIEIVLKDGGIISPTIALKLMKSFKVCDREDRASALSTREKQVLEVLVTGASAEKTADILDVSVHTVRTHVRNIYEKLHVRNRTELVKKAGQLGFG